MKKLLVVGILFAILPAGVGASLAFAQSTSQSTTQWGGYSQLPNALEASVAADESGAAHVLQLVFGSEYEIRYLSSSYPARTINGVSTSTLIDYGNSANGESVGDPDIALGKDGNVHMVWTHTFVDTNNDSYTEIWHQVAGSSGGATQITPDHVLDEAIIYRDLQVAADANGVLHVIALKRTDTIIDMPFHLVYDPNLSKFDEYQITDVTPNSPMRFAFHQNELCAIWDVLEGNPAVEKIYYSIGSFTGTAYDWSGKQLVAQSNVTYPDVAYDHNGDLHFVWTTSDTKRVYYRDVSAQTTEQVSDPGSSLTFEGRARVLTDGNQVHVFYRGLSHAAKPKGGSTWEHTEPITAPQSLDPVMTAGPSEVGGARGRFHAVDDLAPNGHLASSSESIPDGDAIQPAFPGGSVNVVPLSGRLQYQLNLFEAKGAGPTTSISLTYNSKEMSGGLFGPGWTSNMFMHVTAHDAGSVSLVLPNGLTLPFSDSGQGYELASSFGFVGKIAQDPVTGDFGLSLRGGTKYIFSGTSGKLDTIRDPFGNHIRIFYNGSGYPTQIEDMRRPVDLGNSQTVGGRVTQIGYGTGPDAGRIVSFTDPMGKVYDLTYEDVAGGRKLTHVEFPLVVDGEETPEQSSRPTYKFEYSPAGHLTKVIPPRGFKADPDYGYTIQYDPAGRVIQVDDPSEWYVPENTDSETQGPVSWKVFYDDDEGPFAGEFTARVEDRRNKKTIFVFKPVGGSTHFGVTEIWDEYAIQGAAGISPIIKKYYPNSQNIEEETDRWGQKTRFTYVQPLVPGSNPQPLEAWLVSLVKTVEKPHPTTGAFVQVEEFSYIGEEFGNVEFHRTHNDVGSAVRETKYTYDLPTGRLLSTRFPDTTVPSGHGQSNVTVVNTYNDNDRGQLASVTNERGRTTTFVAFNADHGLPTSTLKPGAINPSDTEETRYDYMGNVTKTKPPQGTGNDLTDFTVNTLDDLYRVIAVSDPLLNVTTNKYDLDSNLVFTQAPAGDPTTTLYDRRGFVQGGETPDGSWTQFVDANGSVRKKSTIRGFFTKTEYDDIGRITKVTAPGGNVLVSGGGGGPDMVTTWDYDEKVGAEYKMTQTRVLAGADRVTETFHDLRGRVVRVRGPDGGATVTENFYDNQNNQIATQIKFNTVPQSCTVTFRDERDRVYRTRVQSDAFTSQSAEPGLQSNTYLIRNEVGTVVEERSPLWNPALSAIAYSTKYDLDDRERIVKVFDGKRDLVKEHIWGDDDFLVEVKVPDPETKSTTMVRSEKRTYTARKELKTVENLDGAGLAYTYNAIQGQVNTVTDDFGRITKTTYYLTTQRVDEVTQAYLSGGDERSTKNVWVDGLLTEVRVFNSDTGTVNGSIYKYFYDQADRLERMEYPVIGAAPEMSAERYFYNAFGEESQVVMGGKTKTHAYNNLGQRTSTTWSVAYSDVETMTYNGIGQIEGFDNATHERVMLYDVWLGTPAVEIFNLWDSQSSNWATWKVQSHTYDVARNYTHFVDAENNVHEWVYDANNRVTQMLYNDVIVCEMSYTVGGLLDRTMIHDAMGNPIAETIHYYDHLGRRSRQHTVDAVSRETVADFEWEYNSLDLVTVIRVNHLGVSGTLDYNNRNELIEEIWTGNNAGNDPPPFVPQYGGPTAGLPESAPSGEASGAAGQAVGSVAVTKTYKFDAAGNREWMDVDDGQTVVRTTYEYNAASQLTRESDDQNPQNSVEYLYDEWGNQETRTVKVGGATTSTETYGYNYLNRQSFYLKDSGESWQFDFWPTGDRYAKTDFTTPANTEYYITRGNDVVTDYSTPLQLKNSYVQGTGLDMKQCRIASSGLRRHYLGDTVGTVSITLTDTGSVAETSLKDVWGVQISGNTSSERYGYAQREHDEDSGLVHMRHRMYDPRTGRFTQTDPVWGNRPGEHYVYGFGNPVLFNDPQGLQSDPKMTGGGPTGDIATVHGPTGKVIGSRYASGAMKLYPYHSAVSGDYTDGIVTAPGEKNFTKLVKLVLDSHDAELYDPGFHYSASLAGLDNDPNIAGEHHEGIKEFMRKSPFNNAIANYVEGSDEYRAKVREIYKEYAALMVSMQESTIKGDPAGFPGGGAKGRVQARGRTPERTVRASEKAAIAKAQRGSLKGTLERLREMSPDPDKAFDVSNVSLSSKDGRRYSGSVTVTFGLTDATTGSKAYVQEVYSSTGRRIPQSAPHRHDTQPQR